MSFPAPGAAASPNARILVVASTFPASPTDPVPAFVRDQIVAMAAIDESVEFHVLAPHDRRSATRRRVEHRDFVEHRFHYFWPRSGEQLAGRGIMPALRESPSLYFVVPFLFLGEFFATWRLTRRLRPAVLYAHWFTPQAIVASWVSRLTGVPFVFTTHASDVDVWRKIPGVGRSIVRTATRGASAITAVSTRSMGKLTAFLDDRSSASPRQIIAMGVETTATQTPAEVRRSARKELGLGPGNVILFIGRLVEKKGVEYLLDALASLEGGDWQLIVAGDGPSKEALEARSHNLGLDSRVRFTGYTTGEAKRALFDAADVMVVPSVIAADGDAEGLPVALLEGLAAGLVCIATAESGADDIITDGVDGFLCAERDVVGLAANLKRALALSADARLALTGNARALAQSFSWPAIARRHWDFLFAPILESGKHE